jgi:tetratricopeptide (TPR) repeat protein
MNPYWMYYAATFFFAFANSNPRIAVVAVVFFLLRRWLPDPVAIFKNMTRVGALRRQALLNAANVPARRDLGAAYLELRMPKTALRWLNEAQILDPRNQDVAYLRGLALLRGRSAEEALAAFGQAVGAHDEDVESNGTSECMFRRDAEAYMGAAEALHRLGRFAQAEEALAMSARLNSSWLLPLLQLARVRRRQGDADGAGRARLEARRTWSQLPGYMRRRQFGSYLQAWLPI